MATTAFSQKHQKIILIIALSLCPTYLLFSLSGCCFPSKSGFMLHNNRQWRPSLCHGMVQGGPYDNQVRHHHITKVTHDGPVTTVTRSPFFSDLVLTVGGYLLAVWRETELQQPLIVKSSGEAGLTGGCWSLSRASVVFTSCEDGSILCWSLLTGGNSPIQRQNTSGYTITAITGYQAVDDPSESLRGHFLSIADTTGTIRLLSLPRHMHETR